MLYLYLFHTVGGTSEPPVNSGGLSASGAGAGGGPNAELSLSDYLKKFGSKEALPEIVLPPKKQAKNVRRIRDEEVLLIVSFDII